MISSDLFISDELPLFSPIDQGPTPPVPETSIDMPISSEDIGMIGDWLGIILPEEHVPDLLGNGIVSSERGAEGGSFSFKVQFNAKGQPEAYIFKNTSSDGSSVKTAIYPDHSNGKTEMAVHWYDSDGNMVKRMFTSKDGSSVVVTYDDKGNPITTKYDGDGNVIPKKDDKEDETKNDAGSSEDAGSSGSGDGKLTHEPDGPGHIEGAPKIGGTPGPDIGTPLDPGGEYDPDPLDDLNTPSAPPTDDDGGSTHDDGDGPHFDPIFGTQNPIINVDPELYYEGSGGGEISDDDGLIALTEEDEEGLSQEHEEVAERQIESAAF